MLLVNDHWALFSGSILVLISAMKSLKMNAFKLFPNANKRINHAQRTWLAVTGVTPQDSNRKNSTEKTLKQETGCWQVANWQSYAKKSFGRLIVTPTVIQTVTLEPL